MNVPLYNRDKYYRIMDRTQSNYANQLKRISKDAKRSDFILIYYSMALIVYTGKKNAHRFTRKLKNIFSKNETAETVANDKSDEVIIKELNGYISENAPHLQRIHILFLHLCHLLLYVAPIIIFVLGIFFKHTSFEFGGS